MKQLTLIALLLMLFVGCSDAGDDVTNDPTDQTDPDGSTDLDNSDPETDPETDPEPETEEEEAPFSYGDGPLSTLPSVVDLNNGWELTWNDEFDYTDMTDFEANWIYNTWGGTTGLCHRTADNVNVSGGILYLLGKEGSDGVCTYSTGSVQTRKSDFQFGYYEARMKYAAASGINNSFWFWNGMDYDYPYEIDMNEGHYPNIINTNQHFRYFPTGATGTTDADRVNCGYTQLHHVNPNGLIDVTPQSYHDYETPITTTKVRFKSNDPFTFHIREIKMYAPNSDGYPTEWVESGNNSYFNDQYSATRTDPLVNHATKASITTNNAASHVAVATNMIDEKSSTSWYASSDLMEKEITFEFDEEIEIGHIQLISGWYSTRSYKSGTTTNGVGYSEWDGNDSWTKPLAEYTLEYYDGNEWVVMTDYNTSQDFKLSDGFHNYGMYWDEDKIIIYFDGHEIRTIDYDLCIDSSGVAQCYWNGKVQPVWSDNTIYLSMLVLQDTAGAVSDEIIGTSQQIEWVRVYQKK